MCIATTLEFNSSFSSTEGPIFVDGDDTPNSTNTSTEEEKVQNGELSLTNIFDNHSAGLENPAELNASLSLLEASLPRQVGCSDLPNGAPKKRQAASPIQFQFSLTDLFTRSFRRVSYKQEEKEKKRVRFASENQTFTKTYTLLPRVKKMLWYDEAELSEMQDQLLQVVEKEIPLDTRTDCWRGLEVHMDSDRSINIEENNFILLEHLNSIKYYSGLNNESFDIESLASCINSDSVNSAEMMAAQDSAEAYTIYLETMEPEQVNPFFR